MCCSAILAHIILKEKLNMFGMLGCMLCITGSVTIVLHAPEERAIASVLDVWHLALQPGKPRLTDPYAIGASCFCMDNGIDNAPASLPHGEYLLPSSVTMLCGSPGSDLLSPEPSIRDGGGVVL